MARSRPARLAAELPGWLTASLVAASFATLRWLERRRPLRRETERKLARNARNLAVAALSGATIRLVERPVTSRLTRLVHRRGWGLVPRLGLRPGLEVALAVLLLDYTLFVWHVLTHRTSVLWRFHVVHHADRDLDATTALRFHFAEMALSVPWRAAQVVVVGAAPLSLSTWQTLTLLAILFHHANVALPVGLERWLCRILMTPRLHGIHHSVVAGETDSNWGTILSLPDWLHRTALVDVPQAAVEIGAPGVPRGARLDLPRLLPMPLAPPRKAPAPARGGRSTALAP
jgi:sterol desaturase/sphingolipid hydroxylase (fatty acid hydroxylase superfamily)